MVITEENHYAVIDEREKGNVKIEVLQYDRLDGCLHVNSAQSIYYANQSGVKMKRVRFTIEDTSIIVEPGLLHYMKGNLELSSSTGGGEGGGGLWGLGKSLMRSVAGGESMFQTKIEGTGEIYLEPSFGHFIITELEDEALVADRGIFYAADGDMEVTATMQKNLSSALFGGEGLFQTNVKGSGLVVFCSPVPLHELEEFDLEDDKLFVDGNFAILRSGELEFKSEKSSKSFFGTLTSGEGLLQTFEGTGKVWLAPTQKYYEGLEEQRLAQIQAAKMQMAAAHRPARNDDSDDDD